MGVDAEQASRFAGLDTASAVAVSDFQFDAAGRLVGLEHRRGADPLSGTLLAGYGYTWDAASRLTGMDFLPDGVNSPFDYTGEDVTFTYDDRDQLIGADRTSEDESYMYDENVNRTLVDGTSSYTTGAHNRLLSDGAYFYEYDAEGNRTYRTDRATGQTDRDTSDHRNRLTRVTTEDHTYLDFNAVTIDPWLPGTNDGLNSQHDVLDDGATLHLWQNAWKEILVDRTITADTVLELEFFSDDADEWHGVGYAPEADYAAVLVLSAGPPRPVSTFDGSSARPAGYGTRSAAVRRQSPPIPRH